MTYILVRLLVVISWSITYYVHLQASFFILVRPVSKNLYRRINKVVVELLWLELVWLFDWWAGIKVFRDPHYLHSQVVLILLLWVCYFNQKAFSNINK